MRHRIVIRGSGTGGTLTANRLHKAYGDSAEIVVIDRDDRHVYQPGLLFVPLGLAELEEIVRPATRSFTTASTSGSPRSIVS
jgi:sulfide:quinone oxidoreductase